MKTTRFNGLLLCICMLAFAFSVANARPESEIEMLSKDAQKYFVIKEPFFLESKKGIKYKIFIAHTKDLGDSKNLQSTPYRTLFVLDGNAQFPMALNVCTQEFTKKQKGKNAPLSQAPLLIVGIGYEGEKPYDMPSRTRDFLPKLSPKDLSIAPKNAESVDSKNPKNAEYERASDTINGASSRNEILFNTIQNYSGGQEDFYSFLSHELTPFLQKSYVIDSKHFGIFGHSFGGLFVLSALQQEAQIFSHYFSASPSIWIFQTPRALQIPDSKRVVISVGERENVAILKNYVALQKVKNSDLSFFVIPNVGHGGSIKPSLKRAFELLGEKK
ncbi:hypothetical protein CQA49_07345 [Helicobacter sp. MIT 00-7814]|uniref:alpha/beta hydrolase n=1 Tax=unclassified Helicobacter TaxID=2593540 RepID=UPI000E1F197F|nr:MULTISPECIES: alpha/beta hydrolase-fold protein [unclassified Helicobacter]RDU52968.1 hypothetical protein CQA49_07345 [Helicobacter sp. MIT 00-7814]RDU53872.1 hypothetical protein CQA37_06495 [Helicobacter sp. MIT 99-10781]